MAPVVPSVSGTVSGNYGSSKLYSKQQRSLIDMLLLTVELYDVDQIQELLTNIDDFKMEIEKLILLKT